MSNDLSPCPIPHCQRGRKPNQIMCGRHWFRVPKGLRDLIWSYARRGESCPEWREACRNAVDIVTEKEKQNA